MMVYIMFFFEIITGFSMYAMIDPNGIIGTLFAPIITLFGGEYKVHIIHHYIAWGLLILYHYSCVHGIPRRCYGGIGRSIGYGFRYEILRS